MRKIVLSEVLKCLFLRLSYYNVICRGENREYHPKFHLTLLRSAKYGWNNVGKLEIVLKGVANRGYTA